MPSQAIYLISCVWNHCRDIASKASFSCVLRRITSLFSANYAENNANNLRKTCRIERKDVYLQPQFKQEWDMTYLNQFHKESTERMLRKLAEWKKSPTSSIEAAQRMKQNLAMALRMEVTYTASKAL